MSAQPRAHPHASGTAAINANNGTTTKTLTSSCSARVRCPARIGCGPSAATPAAGIVDIGDGGRPMADIHSPRCSDCTEKTHPSADAGASPRSRATCGMVQILLRPNPEGVAASRFAQLTPRLEAADRLIQAQRTRLL